jgi:hypothetical protein
MVYTLTINNTEQQKMTIENLAAAIEEFKSIAGPITFTAEDNGDSLTLTAAYEEDCPLDEAMNDEPWTQFGGYKILERAGYDIGCGNAGMDSYKDRNGDPVVSQWVTFSK